MGSILSTLDVDETERLAYWCDLVCSTFVNLDVKKVLRTPSFFGSIDSRYLNHLQFSHVKSEEQRVVRSRAQISQATQDYFLISLQLVGKGSVFQQGRAAELQQGHFCLYDTTRTYELFFTNPFEQMVLQMPRDRLKPLLALPEKSAACAVNGCCGLGKITRDLILSTYREMESFSSRERGRISDIIADLLAACINQSVCGPRRSPRTRTGRLLEMKYFIGNRLHDPLLSVEMVADAFGLSTRSVHSLFTDEDTTVAALIREKRLQKCKHDLQDPGQSAKSIADVALSRGFGSASHFSRLFSKRFGLTPRDFRKN